ncbi:MAG: Na+/H+ antiporter NhaA [Hyphomonadaceae bacterium]
MERSDEQQRWWEHDAAPGALLVIAALASFALQNSPARSAFEALLHQPVGFVLGPLDLHMDVAHFVADGLMAIFFLYVGLELKRETIEGPFRNREEALAPFIAALGGMIAPALVFLAIAAPASMGYARGWAIPAATDIAFALGVLSLLGKRVPASLRLFLLALAIIDDLGAILIIAFFYTDAIAGWALGGALASFLIMLMLNRAGLRSLGLYWILAVAMWCFMLASGVHATIAGVLSAMAIPMRSPDGGSPLIAAEHELKPWVLLGVMPLFALANAGAPLAGIGAGNLAHPLMIATALGLSLGKTLGIFGGAMIAARALGLALPAGGAAMLGIAALGGVGFTMSLFIGALAFGEGPEAAPMRLGVLAGSALSAAAGLALLNRALPSKAAS